MLQAFWSELPLLWKNSLITLQEAFIGLLLGVSVGFIAAVLMDAFDILYKAFYPLLIITQTIPSVAIAPLLVLWFGYEMTPKIVLIVISTFFPVTVGLLDGFRGALTRLGARIRPFGSILLTAALTNMVACNQTLAIMLTEQLCAEVEPDREKMAITLENTVVVLAPLVPWSIACSVTTTSSNAPMASILTASFLWLIPIWNYIMALIKKDGID